MNTTEEVPDFLEECNANLARKGNLSIMVRDIESCYPKMPKETIRAAMSAITTKMSTEKDVDGCAVTRGI